MTAFDPTSLLIAAYLDLCRGARGDIFKDNKVRGVHQLALANVSNATSWLDVETLYIEATAEIMGTECPASLKDMILEIKSIAKERE